MMAEGSEESAAVTAALRPMRFALANSLLVRCMSLGYRLTGKNRYDDYRLEHVHGAPILVIPSVFNPKLLRSGEFFASVLATARTPGQGDVLDMGTGSGVCAIFAARSARRVVAVDINAAAVRCAHINVAMNQLEHKIDVRQGDLFAPVQSERFDLILFNPPFFRGTPRSDRDRAWRSNDAAERFAAQLGSHLRPGGRALILLSTLGIAAAFLEQLRRHGFSLSVVAERRYIGERMAIFSAVPR